MSDHLLRRLVHYGSGGAHRQTPKQLLGLKKESPRSAKPAPRSFAVFYTMDSPTDHATDVIHCMLTNGFTLMSFLSTILTSSGFGDILCEIQVQILNPEPELGSTVIVRNWILTSAQAIYAEEIQVLMEKESGLHMNAAHLHPAQLEDGRISTLKSLFESKAPAVWALINHLLTVESKTRASVRDASRVEGAQL
ncbi:uncharacterized protein EI90DRAFT_3136725 [Cantharellus anzutake]|uniref:uncharacterized protein n=1 Tax=Cantharellus anzutake TaxID=1750568 RepID=UPI0019072A06|nr:uncharacterized protein EI90DRAFT_3136725 [Cantharellus anzutake]KAF8313333.1 hypothetical protein EI90DRAFT_3136725 [Cantharellus anzutake]